MSTYSLTRRGFKLGPVESSLCNEATKDFDKLSRYWNQGRAIKLPELVDLDQYHDAIKNSSTLYQSVLKHEDCDSLLAAPPYCQRLDRQFESLGSSYNEGDKQEITTVFFDAIENSHDPSNANIRAEDLWLKVSWLSFYEDDKSLRFRFSFGVDFEEDVASDPNRQFYAAELADAVFPESDLITKSSIINSLLCKLLYTQSLSFVERIIYFNAPNGGAYFHHDKERGHAGVIYAQLTGATFWLALPKKQLVAEIIEFVQECNENDDWPPSLTKPQITHLKSLVVIGCQEMAKALNSFSDDAVIHLINECERFVQSMISKGFGFIVEAGEVMLLPQDFDELECWHTVFSLSEEAGQALSFAIRG